MRNAARSSFNITSSPDSTMPRYLIPVCAALFAASALHAQVADSVRHLPAAALREAVADAPGEQASPMHARMMVDAGAYTVIALRRTADGEAEVHAGWDDVMMIQTGTATLLSGGEVAGARQTAPGELRGGRITGGARRTLAPGDVVTVPAGIPHQMLIGAGESITYLVVKVRRTSAPPP
jgi:mannose-6-phosphate isomerase-like protein (cupin superfamily)